MVLTFEQLLVILTVGVLFATWGVVFWTQKRQIDKCIDLLSARTFGEYATGKKKMAEAEKGSKQANEIDPGF